MYRRSFSGWWFQDIRQPFMALPSGMHFTSCSAQWGGCDTVILPGKAAFSSLKLSCPGAKFFVFEKRGEKRRREEKREEQWRGEEKREERRGERRKEERRREKKGEERGEEKGGEDRREERSGAMS